MSAKLLARTRGNGQKDRVDPVNLGYGVELRQEKDGWWVRPAKSFDMQREALEQDLKAAELDSKALRREIFNWEETGRKQAEAIRWYRKWSYMSVALALGGWGFAILGWLR